MLYTAVWIDLQEFNGFKYVVDIDQHRFYSADGIEWLDKKGFCAMTIGFKNAEIILSGGPLDEKVVL